MGSVIWGASFRSRASILALVVVVTLLVFAGCASVPPNAVSLSKSVSEGIESQHRAMLLTIDAYFRVRQEQLDEAFEQSLATFFETLTGGDEISVNASQLQDVADFVLERLEVHNQNKRELNRTRDLLVEKVRDEQAALIAANATVTALLQSAVEVRQATDGAIQTLEELTDSSIDLNGLLTRIDALLLTTGDYAGQALDVYSQVEQYLNTEMEDE